MRSADWRSRGRQRPLARGPAKCGRPVRQGTCPGTSAVGAAPTQRPPHAAHCAKFSGSEGPQLQRAETAPSPKPRSRRNTSRREMARCDLVTAGRPRRREITINSLGHARGTLREDFSAIGRSAMARYERSRRPTPRLVITCHLRTRVAGPSARGAVRPCSPWPR